MSIRQKETLLFSEWERRRESFVRDGVVSEMDYVESELKIAVILKEVNDPDGGGWDLRKFLLKGARHQTWNNVSRWVHGIRNRHAIPGWYFYRNINRNFRQQQLRSICVINLKKKPGGATADYNQVKHHASKDGGYIRRQYAMYDPDLTICGGTGDLFKKVVGHTPYQWHETNRGIGWYETATNKYVVNFKHPSAKIYAPFLL